MYVTVMRGRGSFLHKNEIKQIQNKLKKINEIFCVERKQADRSIELEKKMQHDIYRNGVKQK